MISYDNLTAEMFLLPEAEQPYLSGNKNAAPQIYIGLANWNYKENLKKKNSPPPQPGTLAFYSNHFNAIELNATHSDIPTAEKLNKWYQSVENTDFKFCPQFYKGITDSSPIGLSKMGLTNDFIQSVKRLKEKLGTSFMQLGENNTAAYKDSLIQYLQHLPTDFAVSLEIRDPDWIQDPELWPAFVKQLNQLNKGLVISDCPGSSALVHTQLSNATAFVRFYCQGDHELDLFRIEEWKKQLKAWFLQGLEQCYFFLHIQNTDAEEDFINYVQYSFKF